MDLGLAVNALTYKARICRFLRMATTRTIEYLNVLPGSGKTHWIADQLASYLIAPPDEVHATIYVAPTLLLLDQVDEHLRSRLPPDVHGRIRPVHHRTRSALTVDRRLMLSLGDRPRDTTEAQRSNRERAHGTVYLITQECFFNLPLSVPKAERIAVFFDEMRSCIREVPPVLADVSLINDCFEVVQRIEGSTYCRVRAKDGARAMLKAMLKKVTQREARGLSPLGPLIDQASRDRYEVWISMPKAANSDKPRRFFHISLPSVAFAGWKRVVLASAWIEQSQMFFLMAKGKHSVNQFVLKNITGSQFLSGPGSLKSDRQRAIINRLRRLVLVPLSKNEGPPLTKRHLRGVLVEDQLHERLRVLAGPNGLSGTDADLIQAFVASNLHASERPPAQLLSEDARRIADAIHHGAIGVADGAREHSFYARPLDWYVQKATRVIMSLRREGSLDARLNDEEFKPLLCVNRSLVDQGISSLADVNVRPGSEARASEIYEVLPPKPHGSNKWMNRQVIVFLCSLNPTPSMVSFFNAYCGEGYDYLADFLVTSCGQAIARTAIRDAHSTEPVYAIVADTRTANEVRRLFGGLPTVDERFLNGTDANLEHEYVSLDQREFLVGSLEASADLSRKRKLSDSERVVVRRKRQQASEATKKSSSADYAKYRSLCSWRSQLRKQLQSKPTPSLEQKLAGAEREIASLRERLGK